MSNRNRMPGLRQKGGIWHIEKRSKYCENGWLRESTGTSCRATAEEILIRRLAEIRANAERKTDPVFTFKEAAFRYLEDVAHKASADTIALHIDQMTPFIGHLPLAHVHDDTVTPFVTHELKRGLAPKSINNQIGVIATVLKRAAGKWRTHDGQPWLRQVPPILTRLSLVGEQRSSYPLSWDEQDTLLGYLPQHLVDPVLFAVNTGCREQEICGLRWDWEIPLPQLNTSAFVLPGPVTKTRTERIVVLNSIARSAIEACRHKRSLSDFVFGYRGNRLSKLRTSARCRAWTRSGLPDDPMISKGVHNLRHTCGRRLRAAGVPLETRKQILGHASGDITTHYSAAELGELLTAVERITSRDVGNTPTLTIINGQGQDVGNVSEDDWG